MPVNAAENVSYIYGMNCMRDLLVVKNKTLDWLKACKITHYPESLTTFSEQSTEEGSGGGLISWKSRLLVIKRQSM